MASVITGSSVQANNIISNQVNVSPLKNWIINGGFDVWQRGTSQTSSGYGSDDRWANEHGVSTKTVSRQAFTVGQTDVPNNPNYFSRIVVTSGNTAGSFVSKMHRIEDVTKLAGKTVSLSFWAKSDANKNLSFQLAQNFGSGGSPTIFTLGLQKIALTTSWQRFTKTINLPSILGKTVGANNFTLLWFLLDAGSDLNALSDSLGNQSGTFDIANVSLIEGSVPVEWQTEAYADVLRQCQRYFWKSFPQETAPGYNKGLSGAIFLSVVSGYNDGFALSVNMRAKPTLTSYNPSGASGQSTTGATLGNNNSSESIISVEYGSVVGNTWAHITADAEL